MEQLKFSFRSVELYAPWVRHIYLITNGQVPTWLNLDHPKIKIIEHKDIFPDKNHLPTFSSPAIEINMHNIPGIYHRLILQANSGNKRHDQLSYAVFLNMTGHTV